MTECQAHIRLMQSEKPLSRSSKIQSIQILRGVAAIVVAIYHVKELTNPEEPFKAVLSFLFNNGPAGVSLFFVISGFIMVYITDNRKYSLRDIGLFFFHRFIRVWPAYAVITLAFAFIVFRFHIGWESTNIIKSLLFIPLTNDDPPYFGYSTLPVGWSLNYEIYFYFLVGLSLFFKKYKWTVFFLLILVTLVIIPVSTGHFTLDPNKTYNYGNGYLNMMTNPVIWNFVYGILIGLSFTHDTTYSKLTKVFSSKYIVSTIVILSVWQYLSGFFGGLGPLKWGLSMASLFIAFIYYTDARNSQFPKWLEAIGDMSFSIYLLHLPVRVFLEEVFRKLGYPLYSQGTAMFLLTMAMTILLSALSYRYLELRLSRFLRDLIQPSKRKVL
ncbi:acyltransferase [Dyadobacter luteus]|uniref:Acyltransferase n=2 Tax=Dyadobacter luteus TaxID=2259619 RepID=A0A3D8YA60_9BACT|nr:acyltransferase [Dyadobacter luteus]